MSKLSVSLRNVVKRYGSTSAVSGVSFDVVDDQFVSLLGPSGCGKTTTLRMIAGLESLTSGELHIDGKRVNDVPIHKRNVGMVFQNLALFPHKSVFDNVAYGLHIRGLSKAASRDKTMAALEMVRLPQFADRMPTQLSGGQQQRVAIARAIVFEPSLLLLDEPLSALDAGLREEMRSELKRIQRTLHIPTIFVTHDQAEALAMSDQIIVMNGGRIEQQGTPFEVFSAPTTEFVARFFGDVNEIEGTVSTVEPGTFTVLDNRTGMSWTLSGERQPGSTVRSRVRAERLSIAPAPRVEHQVSWQAAEIVSAEYLGVLAKYIVRIGSADMKVLEPLSGPCHAVGQRVFVGFPSSAWVSL